MPTASLMPSGRFLRGRGGPYFLSAASTAMKAFCGIWTWPTCFIFALPFFCFSRSFFFRVRRRRSTWP